MYKTASRFSQRATRSRYSIENYSEPKNRGFGKRSRKKTQKKLGAPSFLNAAGAKPRLYPQQIDKSEARKRLGLRMLREDMDRREAEKKARQKAEQLRILSKKTRSKKDRGPQLTSQAVTKAALGRRPSGG